MRKLSIEKEKIDFLFSTGQTVEPVGQDFAAQDVGADSQASPMSAPTNPVQEKADREQVVRETMEHLRNCILEMAMNIHQMQLTEDQVSDILGKFLATYMDSAGDITVQRVEEIVNDIISTSK